MTTKHRRKSRVAPGTVDGRTREAALMRRTRAELTAHLGGTLTATQRVLVDRAVMLRLHLYRLDAKATDAGGMNEHDGKTYLAFSNSLTRLLREVGLKAAPRPPMTIHQLLAARAAEAGA